MKMDDGGRKAKKNMYLMKKGSPFLQKVANKKQEKQNSLIGIIESMLKSGGQTLLIYVIGILKKIITKKE